MFNLGSKNFQRVSPNKSPIGISRTVENLSESSVDVFQCKTSLLKIQTEGKKSSCSTKYLPHRIHGTGIFTYQRFMPVNLPYIGSYMGYVCMCNYVYIYIYVYLWITKKVEGRSNLGPFFAFCCQVFTALNGPFPPIHSQVGCTGLHWTKNHPNKLMFFWYTPENHNSWNLTASFPLKKLPSPIGNACLPTTIFQGKTRC